MTVMAPYRPAASRAHDGFGRLVHAEWTKFRTVRGWVVTILLAPLLIVGVALLQRSECGIGDVLPNGTTFNMACPASPTGPGGEAVTDRFYFAHQALTGNGSITARVTSLTGEYSPHGGGQAPGADALAGYQPGVQPWAKAGVMISASTAPGAAYAATLVTGSHGTRMQWNYTGDAAGRPGTVAAAAPGWLRITRAGDTVRGYDSPDGTHWTLVNTVALPGLPATAQIGLFTTSPSYQVLRTSFGASTGGTSQTLATGRFDNVRLSWPGAGTTWTGTSVGAQRPGPAGIRPGPPGPDPFRGGFTAAAGTYTVSGSGDIAPDVPGGADGNGMTAQNALIGTIVGLIAVIIVAALFMTAEYRRGLVRLTFAASPRRGRVLAAKAVVIGLVTFVAVLAGAVIALPVGVRQLRAGGNYVLPMSALTEARMLAGVAAMLAVAAVLALALGTLARRGVTAITVVIVVIFLPFLLGTLQGLLPLGAQEWLLRLTPAAAFAVIQVVPAYHQVLAPYSAANGYFPLSWWAGFGVLCLWAAAALAAAAYVLRRRDV